MSLGTWGVVRRFWSRSWLEDSGRFLLPLLLALALAAFVLLAAGHDPLSVYGLLLSESFGSLKRTAATLAAATPLIFTGFAAAFAFRTGVFNIGVEGCVHLGGIAAAYVGFTFIHLSGFWLVSLATGAAALAGLLWMLIPALLKARLEVDEVVTTLMFNFIAISLAAWAVNGPLLAPGSANSATPMVADAARLPKLLSGSTLNAGFILALFLVLFYELWGKYTALGLETRLAGMNRRFAMASGLNVVGLAMRMMLFSGAVGGIAGGLHTLGTVYRYVTGFSPGYGFAGIAIALFGRGKAWGMLLAALLFGALSTSGATIQLFSDIPIEIVQILQGTIMIFAVAHFSRQRLVS